MVTDPYSVLGVSRDATQEEIKKAYRKMGKLYHPDLHPNDPEATKKMSEINEAYDMLTHPEKYQNREQSRNSGYSNTQGGQYQRNTYGQQTNQGYGNDREYGGYGGYGNFGGFDFEDIFGFGTRARPLEKPTRQPYDSEEIKKVVDFIYMEKYDYASQILNQVISSSRDARWHYLNALTHHGLGNQIKALEEIQKAIQMEPSNQIYTAAYNSMRRAGTAYEENGQDFQKAAEGMQKYCIRFCALQFFCTFCCRCY